MPSGHASKKHMGAGSQGKGTGTGGMTDLQEDLVGENEILSNRDKAQHGDGRGYDSKAVQVDQEQDTATNRQSDESDERDDL